jgi:Leucine-rich repeat (LRR) protein
MITILDKNYDINTTSLYLKHQNLTEIPQEVFQLEDLEILCLSNNMITAISADIQKLKKLKMLYMSDNNITNIPSEIFNIENLEILIMCNNNINSIPLDITKLTNLRQIWLYKNKISVLPTELVKLTKLDGLFLNSNNISEIPKEYGLLSNMEILVFDNNNITNVPIELSNCSKLKMLYLNNNPLNRDEIYYIILKKMNSRHILTPKEYKNEINKNIDGECIVCLSPHDKDTNLVVLSCHVKHIICSSCINMLYTPKCPLCSCSIDKSKSILYKL